MLALRHLPYSGVECIAWIERTVERLHGGLGGIEVAHIVLGGVFGVPVVEQAPHSMLQGHAVVALAHNVVLMKDVAEEVAVIEFMNDRMLHVGRKRLEPVPVVASESDVEGDDVLHLTPMHCTVAHGGSGNSKAMQEGCAALLFRALKEPAAGRFEVSLQKTPRFVDTIA